MSTITTSSQHYFGGPRQYNEEKKIFKRKYQNCHYLHVTTLIKNSRKSIIRINKENSARFLNKISTYKNL